LWVGAGTATRSALGAPAGPGEAAVSVVDVGSRFLWQCAAVGTTLRASSRSSRVGIGVAMRTLLVGVSLVFALVAPLSAQVPKTVPPEILAAIEDDGPLPPLPRGFAPGESRRVERNDVAFSPLAPPAGMARAQAEYEASDGLLVRWGTFNALLTQLTVAITTGDPDARVYVVVTGTSQQNSASATLSGAGARMSGVRFVTQSCTLNGNCSVWMRDYGPRFIETNGRRAIVDHQYNRPSRTLDDAFPGVWSTLTGESKFDIPLVHGGGNFHLFRNRDARMTRLIVNENPGVSEAQILTYYQQYQGLDLELYNPFPVSYDSTQHIDMWMLPLDDTNVIVSQHASTDGTPFTVTENAAASLAASGYTVHRTPAWNSGGTHFTYANGVLLNKLAIVCQFTGFATQNAQAIATFTAALPGRTVVPVDCSDIIDFAGAIHCIVMHVPDLLFRSGNE
jgi:agmatine deiminase